MRVRNNTRTPLIPAFAGAIAGLQFIGIAEAANPPPLPTQCGATNCGTNAEAFVQFGAASAALNGNTLNVNQATAKAILNWADFNIASGYSVNFMQPSAASSVLNKIWSADPTVIAGSLKANGQIYLYNQNGIVFANGAQVNVAGLTASTLEISDTLFQNGLLSNNSNSGSATTLPAVFQASAGANGTPFASEVSVEAGASLASASGGRIVLLGSAVTNRGTISTPGGQTLLGAGNLVYLAASTDPSLRGLLVEVNSAGSRGLVDNQGLIKASTGNVTLAGLVVNQSGTISATTSVAANGSIYLVAGDTSGADPSFFNVRAPGFGQLLPNNGGVLTLAPGSITQILPDAEDKSTISAQNLPQTFQPSQVELVGKSVNLTGTALIKAPGATVALNAAGDPYQQLIDPGTAYSDGGRIYLDTASSIDVAGLSGVPVSATRNIVQVRLEGNDLQDDPLLRDGPLHGQTVTVDLNKGSTLFNVAPYAGNISLGINEVLTTAGKIRLNSDGDIIARAGSILDVSGGSVAFQGGLGASTTKLLGANGKVYDIGNAPSNILYTGVANQYSNVDVTWGTVTSLATQTYYPGYTQGKSAGEIAVTAPQMFVRGSMLGSTVVGTLQRSLSALPQGGLLSLGCQCAVGSTADFRAPAITLADGSIDALGAGFDYLDLAAALPVDLQAHSTFSPGDLTAHGFSRLTVFSNGEVGIPVGTQLDLGPAGALKVRSIQSINVGGAIKAAGGTIDLATLKSSSGDVAHDITLGQSAILDASGNWINESPLVTATSQNSPLVYFGGKVAVAAVGNLQVGPGVVMDVSGGGWVDSNNKLTKGAAGSISLSASYQPDRFSPNSGTLSFGDGVSLLGSSLAAGKGGSLALGSGSLTFNDTSAGTAGELLLGSDFFRHRGFSSYSFTGQNGVQIGSADPGSGPYIINPVQETLQFTSNMLLQPTGSRLAGFTELVALPVTQRSGASLSLAATGTSVDPAAAYNGSLVLNRNASIATDPGASVTLAARGFTGNLTVNGTVTAPAGSILIQLVSPTNPLQQGSDPGYIEGQQLLLGSSAILSAVGFSRVDTLNPFGYRQGSVLPGGSVSLLATKGYVVTEPGATIDVSGTAAILDIPGAQGVVPTLVAGDAGAVNIHAREGLVLAGELAGRAATWNQQPVSGAAAGTLSIGLDLFNFYNTYFGNQAGIGGAYSIAPRTLTITGQSQQQLPVTLQSGSAFISTTTLQSGGFDNISLSSADVIQLDGSLSLAARSSIELNSPVLKGGAGSNAHLVSAYVSLGNESNDKNYFATDLSGVLLNPLANDVLLPACAAAACDATLAINAQLIDVNGISGWTGFSSELLSSTGDIRLGTGLVPFDTAPALSGVPASVSRAGLESALNTFGNLTLQAQQVYPTTGTNFTVNSPGRGSSVTILGAAGTGAVPLSAGGTLAVNAPLITQAGVLKAPFGQITLTGLETVDPATNQVIPGAVVLAPGSTTSVSGGGKIIPYGSTVNGKQWTYAPNALVTQVVPSPPAKSISLRGTDVDIEAGANLDLSGGGDLYAYEWIAGPGGSRDVLGTSPGSYSYAIVPSLGSAFGSIDAQYRLNSNSATNHGIYLTGMPGVPDGYYALLPPRYALLPGAFAVKVIQANSDLAAGSSTRQPDGSWVVSGRFATAGTDILASRTSTILLAPGSVVRTQSQYVESNGNNFFAQAAAGTQSATPRLPVDAGQLQIAAAASLALDGAIDFKVGQYISGTDSNGKPIVQTGIGGEVSIEAPSLLVVDAGAAQPSAGGALQLDAQALNRLGAQSLVLGATTRNTGEGEQVTVGVTQSIELSNPSTTLTAPDILLAARDQIVLDAGAGVHAAGGAATSSSPLLLQGGGALLFASSSRPGALVVDPTVPSNPAGQLLIGPAGNLQAAGGLLLYSSGTTTAAADSLLVAPAVGLYSSRISLGDVPTGNNTPAGLNLTPQLLAKLTGLKDLTLGSSSTIDFYGPVRLGVTGSSNLPLNSVSLDAWGLAGYGSGDSVIQASSISLRNSNDGAIPASLYASAPTGTGTLTLRASSASGMGAGQIALGSGAKSINGYSSVTFSADDQIRADSTGSLDLLGSSVALGLRSSTLSASSAAFQAIRTSGAVTIDRAATPTALQPAPAAGGRLEVTGTSIAQNGNINLPAGNLVLHATTGDVTLSADSATVASGYDRSYVVTDSIATGGSIQLLSDQGNVVLSAGSLVDVSGVSSVDGRLHGGAGSLTVLAPHGLFSYSGSKLRGSAAGGQRQGSFVLDVNTGLSGDGFNALQAALATAGFTLAQSIRTRSDTLVTVSGTIRSGQMELVADSGAIDIAGKIDTSGNQAVAADAGRISIWAGNGLTVESSAQLLANGGAVGPLGPSGVAAPSHGGDIILSTATGVLAVGANGKQAAIFSARGSGDVDSDGTITLRAPRTADNLDVSIAPPVMQADTRKPLIIEGVRSYAAANLDSLDSGTGPLGTLDVADTNGSLYQDSSSFLANASAIQARIGLPGAEIRPGLDISSPGDLVLHSTWDLASWSAALGAPVDLSVRAAGNLFLDSSLSDGFTSNGGATAAWAFGVATPALDSANIRLTAGADLSSASPMAVVGVPLGGASTDQPPATGNLIVTPGNIVRTGTGNIDIATGGDLLLGYSHSQDASGQLVVTQSNPLTSAIYTAGRPATLTPEQAAIFTAPTGGKGVVFTPSYATGGGAVTVNSNHDIRSAPSAQLVSDWLWRRGVLNADGTIGATSRATSWWLVFKNFNQGIGALGGGGISLQASGNIENISAVVPTTGRLLGNSGALPTNADLLVYGGGSLQVQAGGNIDSGVFENDWGNASLRSGGALGAATTLGQEIPAIDPSLLTVASDTPIFPVLLLGHGRVDVSARSGVTLNYIGTSTSIPGYVDNAKLNKLSSYFYMYDESTALNVQSSGGDVVLKNTLDNLPMGQLTKSNASVPALYDPIGNIVAPATLNVAALSGSIGIQGSGINMYSSPTGNLDLLAQGSVTSDVSDRAPGEFFLYMGEALPSRWSNPLLPAAVATTPGAADLPAEPLHIQDKQPIHVVANTGNIAYGNMNFPKMADVIAGGDILDVTYAGKNLNPGDVTLIQAGDSLSYSTPADPITNALLANNTGINQAGPGFLEVLAGGTLDLGDSSGVITTGSLNDGRLALAGASIVVGAGFGKNTDGSLRAPATQAFTTKYLLPDASGKASPYAAQLLAYVQKVLPGSDGPKDIASALPAFLALRMEQQLPFVAKVLSDELSATGIAHNLSGATYDRGYTAIDTLFPTVDANRQAIKYSGDINMFFSQFKTEQGGDIDLLAPGGSVLVGVPNPPAALSLIKALHAPEVPAEANLGILALSRGAIHGFANQNFEVNQSRILTLEGGDIILWASNGNIDAGRGAKTASGAPPPVIQTDSNGRVFVNPLNDVSGSGIGQLVSTPGILPGLVNLIAPKGAVDAGDAGIRVAGNLNIAAVQVIGASNITVAGTATGVPTSDAGALSGALSGANSLGDAGKDAVDQLGQSLTAGASLQQLTDGLMPTFIVVKMFCLGIECQQL